MHANYRFQFVPSSQKPVDNAVIQNFNPGFHFDTHLHHTLELLFCLKGNLTVTVLGSHHLVNAGEYFLFFPDVPHAMANLSDAPCSIMQIHFHSRPFAGTSDKHIFPNESVFDLELSLGKRKYLTAICDSQLNACISGIYREMNADRPDSNTLIQLYLAQLNVLLSREISAIDASGSIHQNRYLLRASVFIGNEYMKKITVQDVADATGISPRYLAKLFNDSFKMGVSAYINHIRISKAIEFMYSNPQYSLTKLALDVGFSSQQYFTKVFKEEMTVSPKRYFALHTKNI